MQPPLTMIARLRRFRASAEPIAGCGAAVARLVDGVGRLRSANATGLTAWREIAPDALRERITGSSIVKRELVLTVASAAWRKRIADWLRQGGEVALVRAGRGSFSRVRLVTVSMKPPK